MKERSMCPIGNDCDFKNFAEEKICKLFVVAIDFIALEFYRKLQKIALEFWLYRVLVQLQVISRVLILKFLLNLDCSEFNAVKINRAVDITYNHYQSHPIFSRPVPSDMDLIGWFRMVQSYLIIIRWQNCRLYNFLCNISHCCNIIINRTLKKSSVF